MFCLTVEQLKMRALSFDVPAKIPDWLFVRAIPLLQTARDSVSQEPQTVDIWIVVTFKLTLFNLRLNLYCDRLFMCICMNYKEHRLIEILQTL